MGQIEFYMKKIVILGLLILFGCRSQNKPEEALKNYMSDRLSGRLTSRDAILTHATGKYWAAINALSDEEFKKFENLSQVKQNSYKLLSSKCTNDTCYLTYSVGYSTIENQKKTFSSEVKKVAELKMEQGEWKIADISNLKTYHESLEPLNPLQE